MRGLCMLGVIGIHVGSYALQNPFVNLELISVLEILSRFGVPAFFLPLCIWIVLPHICRGTILI